MIGCHNMCLLLDQAVTIRHTNTETYTHSETYSASKLCEIPPDAAMSTTGIIKYF